MVNRHHFAFVLITEHRSRTEVRRGMVMREFHSRHARDGADARADAFRDPDASHQHASDAGHPRHEALHDAATRKAESQAYQRRVEVYHARHAKPPSASEVQAERPPADLPDRPSSRIAARDMPEHKEAAGNRKRERPWLPSVEAGAIAVGVGNVYETVNAQYHFAPGRPDGIVVAVLGLLAAGAAWANKRWKDKNGDRPEG